MGTLNYLYASKCSNGFYSHKSTIQQVLEIMYRRVCACLSSPAVAIPRNLNCRLEVNLVPVEHDMNCMLAF